MSTTPTPTSTTALRSATSRDAADSARICYEAFHGIATRHHFPPDFPSVEAAHRFFDHVFTRDDVHGVVAERDGRIVGSNFLWECDAIAGVGPVTVDPRAQDSDVGRQLMQAVLERAAARGSKGVRLVQAAYNGRSFALYTKLGFVVREPLLVLQGTPPAVELHGRRVRPAGPDDLGACREIGEELLGDDRAGELRGAMLQGVAMVVERDSRIVGYTSGVGFFGHSVARENDDLAALIAAAPLIAGIGLLLPARNSALLRWCLRHGLRIVQPLTLMSQGEYVEPRGAFLPSIVY